MAKTKKKEKDEGIFIRQRISASLTPNFQGWKPLNQDMGSLPAARATREAIDATREGKPQAPVPVIKSVKESIALHEKLNPDSKKKKQHI